MDWTDWLNVWGLSLLYMAFFDFWLKSFRNKR